MCPEVFPRELLARCVVSVALSYSTTQLIQSKSRGTAAMEFPI